MKPALIILGTLGGLYGLALVGVAMMCGAMPSARALAFGRAAKASRSLRDGDPYRKEKDDE